ncbi:MAG: hypothetical protein KDC98_09920, partial [Planctomycetes bacterium]|nr:hypothetical protein [Planctomycetota bacterium]
NVTGSGAIDFTADGETYTFGGSLGNVTVSAGIRTFSETDITGSLEQTGGELTVPQGRRLHVRGSARFSNGTVSWEGGNGNLEVIEVDGDVDISGAVVGTVGPNSRFKVNGNWNSSAGFEMLQGEIEFGGGTTVSIAMHGRAPSLRIAQGVKILGVPITISLDLIIEDNGEFRTEFDVSVDGNVTLLGTLARWVTGLLTDDPTVGQPVHSLAGSFTGNGGTVEGRGRLRFLAGGEIATALGTISHVELAGGSYRLTDTNISGTFVLSGGELTIVANNTLNVEGSATLAGGTLHWGDPGAAGGTLAVGGDLIATGTTVGRIGPQVRVACAGSWVSSETFALTDGIVRLEGPSPRDLVAFDELLHLPAIEIAGAGPFNVRGNVMLQANGLTVEASSPIRVGGGRLGVSPLSLVVDGRLELIDGAVLEMAPASSLHVTAQGTLRLAGLPGAKAAVRGSGTGGYSILIDGRLEANQFGFRNMDGQGVVFGPSSSLGAAPFDGRDGVFDLGASAANGPLLDLRFGQAHTFRRVSFAGRPEDGTRNVRRLGGGIVTFADWGGGVGGPEHEIDPSNCVEWIAEQLTTLARFAPRPGPEQITVEWTTSREGTVLGFLLETASTSSGPFSVLASVPARGAGNYSVLHAPLPAAIAAYYRLSVRDVSGHLSPLATGSATPWSASLPANVMTIGPNGAYATVQDGLNAAPALPTLLLLEAGTYPTFQIDNPTATRIIQPAPGAVASFVLTNPLTISRTRSDVLIVLRDVELVSGFGLTSAVDVSACTGAVVFDQVRLVGTAATARVDQSAAALFVETASAGSPGVLATRGSSVFLGACAIDRVDVSTGAKVETCESDPEITADNSARVFRHSGVMPLIRPDDTLHLGVPAGVDIRSAPNDVWVLALTTAMLPMDLAPYEFWQMLLIADPSSGGVAALGITDPWLGRAHAFVTVPAEPSLIGSPFVFQGATFPMAPVPGVRFSNPELRIIHP